MPSDAQLTITWNTPVEKASGCIRILDSSNQEVYSLEVSSGAVSVSGAAMSFSLAGAPLRYGQTYSIKLDNGIVKSQAGVYFHGLEAGEWIITINRPSDTVNMSWAPKPFWQFGGNDYDKPPIPDGTDTQYANQLLLWAQDAGYYGLTLQQCLAMLDAPMYFPVTDQNQTPLLLNDRATTVRQVVEDILFVEALQERIQEQITEPLSDVSLSKAASNPWLLLTSVIPEETKIYETAISWYDQIETYMGQRNQNSNFFLSLGAPAAYVALCEALGMTGDVLKPMLKADFKSFTSSYSLRKSVSSSVIRACALDNSFCCCANAFLASISPYPVALQKSIIDCCTASVYRHYQQGNYQGVPPTLQDFREELLKQDEPEAKEIALAIELFTDGSLNTFAKHTNVDTHSRLICYDILDLGKQLQPIGMLVILDSILNRITKNRAKGRNTFIFIDEIYLLFQHEYSANFLFTLWKRVRKYGAYCAGITQNVDDLLQSHTARTMLANSEFIIMLNQASTDRIELAKLLNISDLQMSYITNVGAGQGLLKVGSSLVPFINKFPRNTELYKLMTTKFGEV